MEAVKIVFFYHIKRGWVHVGGNKSSRKKQLSKKFLSHYFNTKSRALPLGLELNLQIKYCAEGFFFFVRWSDKKEDTYQHRESSEILNSHIAYDNLMSWWQLKAGAVVFSEFLVEWQVLWLPMVWVNVDRSPIKALWLLFTGVKSLLDGCPLLL